MPGSDNATEEDMYQLGTANRYKLCPINVKRLQKLLGPEIRQYKDDFWHASQRLKRYNEMDKEEYEL
jgi:hypothetical protein